MPGGRRRILYVVAVSFGDSQAGIGEFQRGPDDVTRALLDFHLGQNAFLEELLAVGDARLGLEEGGFQLLHAVLGGWVGAGSAGAACGPSSMSLGSKSSDSPGACLGRSSWARKGAAPRRARRIPARGFMALGT